MQNFGRQITYPAVFFIHWKSLAECFNTRIGGRGILAPLKQLANRGSQDCKFIRFQIRGHTASNRRHEHTQAAKGFGRHGFMGIIQKCFFKQCAFQLQGFDITLYPAHGFTPCDGLLQGLL